MPDVLVVQHHPVETPGRIAEVLTSQGHRLETIRTDRGDPVPDDPVAWDGIVVMGGPMGVHDADERPHLASEIDLLRRAFDRDVPVLGVCLGSQLLARALGAPVRPAPRPEIGWHPVEQTDTGRDDPVLGRAPRTFVPLHWHGDVLDLPDSAVALACSEATDVQAFRAGEAWGLLFHLEIDASTVETMVETFPDDVAQAAEDPDAIRAEAPKRVAALADTADAVLGAWAERIED